MERLIAQHMHLHRHGLADFGRDPRVAATSSCDLATPPREAPDSPDFWLPPIPSTASRRPPARSRGHCGGTLVDPESNRELLFESKLERDIALVALADRRVLRIWDQPPAVRYRDAQGRERRHTFDFLFEVTSGARVAIAVKPSIKVERSGILQTLGLIRNQVQGFADHYLLRTEQHAKAAQVQNAEWILRARRMRDANQIEAMADFTATMTEPMAMAAIAMRSGMGPAAWNALINLIDEGRLNLVEPDAPIGELALIRPAPLPTTVTRGAEHA